MRMPSKAQVERIRITYPAGCRVRLIQMDDVQAPPAGTEGTVIGVDDMGSVMIRWDNGSGLSAVLEGGDVIERLEANYDGRN